MENKNRYVITPWLVTAAIFCGLQFIATVMTIAMAAKAGILPDKIFGVLAAGLLISLLLVVLLLLVTERKTFEEGYSGSRHLAKRAVGIIISTITLILCFILLFVFDKTMNVVKKVTELPTVVTEKVNVYVLKEDPAQSLQDAADYTFGITENYDYENTKHTLEKIEAVLGAKPDTHSYQDVAELAEALYNQRAGAIILNEAYASVLEEIDEFASFGEETRILEVIEVEKEVEQTAENSEDDNGYHYAPIRDIDLTKDAFVIYISGNDTRNAKLARSRSDVNILMVVNPVTKRIFLVNTPRDYYVDTSVAPGNLDKLTHCGIYGTRCSMDTLSNLYGGIPVDRYVQVNFNGFVNMIDAIGGITVYSESEFKMDKYTYKTGYNEMNGEMALGFARQRHAFADGDNARGRHQMAIISAVINKLSNSSTLINSYDDILKELEGMIATDITSEEITSLVKMQLSDMASWDISSYAVTGTDGKETTYSSQSFYAYVMHPDEEAVENAKIMIERVLEGGTSY